MNIDRRQGFTDVSRPVSSLPTPGMAQVLARTTPAAGGGVAADTGNLLGPVHIPPRVTANGAALGPGAYSVRITGETAQQERWVEFVSGGRVAARELATVTPRSRSAALPSCDRHRLGRSGWKR